MCPVVNSFMRFLYRHDDIFQLFLLHTIWRYVNKQTTTNRRHIMHVCLSYQVIIGCQVYDTRMFRLLHTLSALSACRPRFNNKNDVIYATESSDPFNYVEDRPARCMIRTYDCRTFEPLTSLRLEKPVVDFALNSTDTKLAVVLDGVAGLVTSNWIYDTAGIDCNTTAGLGHGFL